MNSEPNYGTRLHQHVHAFFDGHQSFREHFDQGPIQELLPGFHAIALSPGPISELWTYVSVGCGLIEGIDTPRLEFLITAESPSTKYVERLAMTAWYHHKNTLGVGHNFPLGEAWLPESTLDHALISLPYPFGEDLEIFRLGDDHVHLYWILPITAEERAYKTSYGLKALESRFDEVELEYWNVKRASVV